MRHNGFVLVFLVWLLAVSPMQARKIRFAPAKTASTGIEHSSFVAIGDFNGDGIPDLAINSTYNQVSVFLGKGDGTFTGPTIYNLTFYVTGSVAVGDYNNDGKLDLAVVGGDDSGNGLAFLSGNGDGTFNAPVYFPTTLHGASIFAVAGDFTNNNALDLFVGGNGSSEVILGNGAGSFSNGQLEDVYGFLVTEGDFNRDGNLDVATTQAFPYNNSNGLSVLLGNGDGTFQTPQGYSGMVSPLGVAAGDFNGDKKLDLAVTDSQSNVVFSFIGNGDGTFTNLGHWYAGVGPDVVAVSDFNMDGILDLAVADYGGNAVSILPGKGDGTFPTLMSIPAGNGSGAVAIADFNHDGSPDMVVVNGTDGTFSVFLNAAGTRVHLSSSADPSQVGQTVTFTATVRSSLGSSLIPSGKVVFRDGSNDLGSSALTDGAASFSTSSLAKGKHNITATYSGDANFNPNRSAVFVQEVN